ncbi:MAG: hypothetical protein JNM00_12480 [Flavobacteriales bacterium]|nr:hypothetical protein [Flavobacteriales bacterium]
MKKLLPFIALFLVVSVLHGQDEKMLEKLADTPGIAVGRDQVDFNDQVQPSFHIEIVAPESEYEKDIKAYFEQKFGVVFRKSGNFLQAEGVTIGAWNLSGGNVYVRVRGSGDGAGVSLLVQQAGTFVDPDNGSEMSGAIRKTMEAQVRDFYLKYYDRALGTQQKNLDKAKKENGKAAAALAKAEKSHGSAEKKLSSYQSAREKLETKQEEHQEKISETNATLSGQKSTSADLKKQLDTQVNEVNAKQREYDALNASGDLNTKQAKRVTKDLGKLRSGLDKIQQKHAKSNAAVSKTENTLLGLEKEAGKLADSLKDAKDDEDAQHKKIKELSNGVHDAEKQFNTTEDVLNKNERLLEDLKKAKEKLAQLQP